MTGSRFPDLPSLGFLIAKQGPRLQVTGASLGTEPGTCQVLVGDLKWSQEMEKDSWTLGQAKVKGSVSPEAKGDPNRAQGDGDVC